MDVTGDGHADILISEDVVFTWYESRSKDGFGTAQRVPQSWDEEKGPKLVFSDPAQTIFLADMCGDGLSDIVRIRYDEVCYWPNLGYGKFGAKIAMGNPPLLDPPDLFDPKRIHLADIDGSGTTDLVYVGLDGISLYFNQSGNSWSAPRLLSHFPRLDSLKSIAVTDLLGNGTACLVWSSPIAGDVRRPMRYIDLMGGQKPHLLVFATNNMGAETKVSYTASTKFYLNDRLQGRPWVTKLPFPVHVIERIETIDLVSNTRLVSTRRYRHGYFDGVEREFRGFAYEEQRDVESVTSEFDLPPIVTKTWFHTGALLEAGDLEAYFKDPANGEYFAGDAQAVFLPDTELLPDLSFNELREAARALKGSVLCQEIYADDGTPKAALPYSVSERSYKLTMRQSQGANRHAVFSHSSENIDYHYERNPADPRISHALTLAVDDFGNILKSVAIGYPRRVPQFDEQKNTLATLTESQYTNPVQAADAYRTPLPVEVKTFELTAAGLKAAKPLEFSVVEALASSALEIAYEVQPVPGQIQKRLIEQVRTLYRKDDLSALLAVGKLESMANPGESYKLSAKIAAATTWKQEAIDKLIAPDANDAKDHFNLNRADAFRNEVNLVKLRKAIGVADKIAVDINRLFDWAKPGSKFWACHLIAEDIRKAARARFEEDDWEQVVKPLNDELRENQKRALVSYCLVQPDLIDWGVADADSLFEFFLIDVQMDACMETSRIKQAISSVQLFIQRCLLGLEEDRGVSNKAIDRPRWEWMQRYRLWEANRKIFLYPENWIRSELRDDKSDFYRELEAELLQKDVSTEVVEDALKNYLFKVGDVANIQVAAIFRDDKAHQLHIFARTHNAPYLYYYRWFDIAKHNWYPWGRVQVDIPSHDDEKDSQVTINGTYLVPAVWNGRILVFIPHFVSKSVTAPGSGQQTPADMGNTVSTDQSRPSQFWEIRIGWSEYRNGKWTPKQLSSDAVYSITGGTIISQGIQFYNFVPRIIEGADTRVVIEISTNSGGEPFGQFIFAGNQIFRDTALPGNLFFGVSVFQVISKKVHSYQALNATAPALIATEPFFALSDTNVEAHIDGVVSNVSHPFVHELLSSVTTGGTDELYTYLREKVVDTNSAFGGFLNDEAKPSYNELKAPYALYDWEVAFHAPMQVADRLVKAQHYEAALKMCHYVLNPFASGNPSDAKRFWKFWPFGHLSPESTILGVFLSLAPGQPNSLIAEWRDSPFQPHLVARGRPTAYMKWVAITYIRILIAWGDYLFQQDTIETINQATQLYILAAHVYGPAGQEIPKRGTVKSETYYSLLDKWDAFGNAMVELELAFPFSNQTTLESGASNGVVGMPNVFGFATSLYFCIPNNPEQTALRDTIDDRLFKIRHCENIAGIFRKLPLFEPPIDPALLVQAAAQGLSLSGVLNDLNSPIPNYRFYYLLQKALEMCGELKSLGSAFLSAREKADGEALARLRATHDTSINNLVMEIRKLQMDESQKAVEALQQSRLAPVSRMEYYLQLIGEEASKVPGATDDFSDLPNQIEKPIDDSSLKLIAYEKEELDKADTAADLNVIAAIPKILEGVLHAIPTLETSVEPIGIGIAATFGGRDLGSIARVASDVLQLASAQMQHESSRAARKAGYLRQLQDRVQQANNAGFEIKNIDRQVLTQQIRVAIANQEIINQQQQIDNALEIEDFLRNKYTSQQLYAWMTDEVRSLYYQAYTLAYDLAKRAEKVFRFERGLATSNFIQFGYWDPAYDGLLSGVRLFNGLKQLEAAFQEKCGYDFEIVKNISLQQLNPLELINLRESGQCEFVIPEVLFDMGFPGQYMRRIKSIALTFACHVGPPTSLNCVLRLQEHKFRIDPKVSGNPDYPEHTDENDERFSTVNVPTTSIAVSTGQNDSGVFELNFRDERYIPFEGAGVISKWKIQLPNDFREFDYSSITDVVMHMRYTALDGGDKLRAPAEASVKHFVSNAVDLSQGEGLFALFDLRHDFPNEWYKSTQPLAGATERVIALGNVFERLPVFTKSRKIQAADVYLFTTAAPSGGFSLLQGADEFPIAGPQAVGTLTSFVAKDIGCPMSGWQIKIKDVKVNIDVLWLVVRYTLS